MARRLLPLAALISTLSFAPICVGATAYHALSASQTVPEQIGAEETFTVALTFKNAGDETWSSQSKIALDIKNQDSTWTYTPITLDQDDDIPPGQSKVFTFQLTAPSEPGAYSLQWQLTKNGKPFGEATKSSILTVHNTTYQAKFISQVIPETLGAGTSVNAKIQFKNNGSVTWSDEAGYRLTAVHQARKSPWGGMTIRLRSDQYVTPGDIVTFNVPIKAPATTGDFAFQWQMHQQSSGWFGEPTPQINIQITDAVVTWGSEFVYQNVAKTMAGVSTYAVTIAMKNVGTKTWNDLDVYLAPLGNSGFNWLIDRVDLAPGESIAPGEIKSFKFDVRAPSSAGKYSFGWQLATDANGVFGDDSEAMVITVK